MAALPHLKITREQPVNVQKYSSQEKKIVNTQETIRLIDTDNFGKTMPLVPTSYTISYEPIYSKYHKAMPEELKTKYEDYVMSIYKRDLTILNDLESLSKKYENPIINNLLYNCYIIANRYKDAIIIAEYNFNKYPDYLFGRLNYASSFLLDKDYKSIPKIFDFKFDLKQVESARNEFHISEVLSFHKILYYYHLGIGEYKNAKQNFEIIANIDIEGKVKRELSRANFKIIKKRIIVMSLSILLTPFMLIFMIYELIKHKIRGNKTK